jgi:hypothetical protein
MKKTIILISVLGLAGCGSSPPPQTFAPLDYSYLRPYVFKVATLNIVNNYVPGADEAALNANNPAPPGATLMAMLNQRMQPSGQPGTGTITVQAASITEGGGNINGQMTVDINLTSADGRSTGFAEASVSASQPDPGGDPGSNDMRAALYNMTKQLMTSINVQLPYQINHNISSWVAWTTPAGNAAVAAPGAGMAPGAIQSAPLGAPGSAAAPMPMGSAAAPSSVGSSPTAAVPTAVAPTPVVPSLVPPTMLPAAGPTALTPPQ